MVMALGLGIGVLGYHWIGGLGWVDSLAGQMIVFAISSIVLLVGLRRVFKGWLMGITVAGDNASDLDEFLGKPVTVVAAIPADGVGKVEFKGSHWNAQCPDSLSTGAAAVITGRDGLCLLVRAK